MKIGIITELFSPSMGGQEIRFEELSINLSKAGHEVEIFTIGHINNLLKLEKLEHYLIHRLVCDNTYINRRKKISRNIFTIFKFSIILLFKLNELKKFDVVIFNIWPLLPQMILGRFLKNKAILDWCEIRSGFLWNLIYNIQSLSCKNHITVNNQISEILSQKYKINKHHIVPIFSGINVSNYNIKSITYSQKRGILYFGRLINHKNPTILLNAYLNNKKLQEMESLTFAGDGPEFNNLKYLAKGNSNIVFLGNVTNDEKIELLNKSKILVLPSKREGFPRVVAEAAACGTPTLTTTHPNNGTVSVVNQFHLGWTCQSLESELSASLVRILENPKKLEEISLKIKIIANENFNWDTIIEKLLGFIQINQTRL